MMFFVPPDSTCTIPAHMVAAEKRVSREFPRNHYSFHQAGDGFSPAAAAKTPAPEPQDLLAPFLAQNATHHGGGFWYRFWNGRMDGKEPPTQMVTWYYDRRSEREAYAQLDESNTFQVNIPLTMLDRLAQPQLTQKLFADLCQTLKPNAAIRSWN